MKRKKEVKRVLSCLLALVLVLSITPSVFAEEPVGGTTIYVDAINGNDTQEGVGTTSDKAYKTVAAAVAAAKSGDTIQLGTGNYTLYKVDSTGHTKGKDLTFLWVREPIKQAGISVQKFLIQLISVQSTTAITVLMGREQLHLKI